MPCRRQFRHRAQWKRQAHEPLDVTDVTLFFRRRKGDGVARGTGAGRAADAMDVICGVRRQVIIQNKLDPLYVDASGGDVGRSEHAIFSVAESIERLTALVQRFVRMKFGGGMPKRANICSDALCAKLCSREDEDRATILAKQFFEEARLVDF